jgi:hypothetical protein
LSTALKVEAASSSETSVTNYKSTRRHISAKLRLQNEELPQQNKIYYFPYLFCCGETAAVVGNHDTA